MGRHNIQKANNLIIQSVHHVVNIVGANGGRKIEWRNALWTWEKNKERKSFSLCLLWFIHRYFICFSFTPYRLCHSHFNCEHFKELKKLNSAAHDKWVNKKVTSCCFSSHFFSPSFLYKFCKILYISLNGCPLYVFLCAIISAFCAFIAGFDNIIIIESKPMRVESDELNEFKHKNVKLQKKNQECYIFLAKIHFSCQKKKWIKKLKNQIIFYILLTVKKKKCTYSMVEITFIRYSVHICGI